MFEFRATLLWFACENLQVFLASHTGKNLSPVNDVMGAPKTKLAGHFSDNKSQQRHSLILGARWPDTAYHHSQIFLPTTTTTTIMRTFSTSTILLALTTAVTAQQLNLGATAVPGAVPGATTPPLVAGTPVPAPPQPATPFPTVDDSWSGCVDPTLGEDNDGLVRIGQGTLVCIVLGSATAWNSLNPPVHYLRLSFKPNADQYARFHVPSSYQDLISQQAVPELHNGSNNVTIHVSSQKTLSFQRIFYTPTSGTGRVYPYLTAIIDVKDGVVIGITWDDSCLFCGKDVCFENTYDYNGNLGNQETFGQPTKGCYVTQEECTKSMAEAAADKTVKPLCDILVYFVWTGTDADGKALQSSAFRFSSFPEQEIKNRIFDNVPDLPAGVGSFFGGDGTEAPGQTGQ